MLETGLYEDWMFNRVVRSMKEGLEGQDLAYMEGLVDFFTHEYPPDKTLAVAAIEAEDHIEHIDDPQYAEEFFDLFKSIDAQDYALIAGDEDLAGFGEWLLNYKYVWLNEDKTDLIDEVIQSYDLENPEDLDYATFSRDYLNVYDNVWETTLGTVYRDW